MVKLISFSLIFLFTNIFCSFVLLQLFLKLKGKRPFSIPGLVLYFLGLGPFACSLLLFYLLFAFHGYAPDFYVSLIAAIFVVAFAYSSSYFLETVQMFAKLLGRSRNDFKDLGTSWTKYVKMAFIFFVIGSYFLNWFLNFSFKPILGHDMLEYAIQAKVFFLERKISFVEHRYDTNSGFYYVALHGFSFPLLSTWERLVASLFGLSSDHYFRSVTGYYGALILILQYVWLSKKSKYMAFLAVVMTYFTHGFFLTATEYHIDTYRIFAFTVAFILCIHAMLTDELIVWILFAVFAGFQAYAHSMGALLTGFDMLLLLIFSVGTISFKLKRLALVALIVLAVGGVHYLLDIFLGTGWIFQAIKYY